MFVYIVLWIYLGINKNSQLGNHDPSKYYIFRNTALICLGVGGIFSLVFHITVKGGSSNQNNLNGPKCKTVDNENKLDTTHAEKHVSITKESNDVTGDNSLPPDSFPHHRHAMTIKDWFCEPQFYQLGCTYMLTRLFVISTSVFMPFYLEITLQLKAIYVAIIPLVMYLSGLMIAVVMECVTKRLGKKLVYCISCIIGGAGSLWIHWGTLKNCARITILKC